MKKICLLLFFLFTHFTVTVVPAHAEGLSAIGKSGRSEFIGSSVDIGDVPCMGFMSTFWTRWRGGSHINEFAPTSAKLISKDQDHIKYHVCDQKQTPLVCKSVRVDTQTQSVRYEGEKFAISTNTCTPQEKNIIKFCYENDFRKGMISRQRFEEICTDIGAKMIAETCTCPIQQSYEAKGDTTARDHVYTTTSASSIVHFDCVKKSVASRFLKNHQLDSYNFYELLNICEVSREQSQQPKSASDATDRRPRDMKDTKAGSR